MYQSAISGWPRIISVVVFTCIGRTPSMTYAPTCAPWLSALPLLGTQPWAGAAIAASVATSLALPPVIPAVLPFPSLVDPLWEYTVMSMSWGTRRSLICPWYMPCRSSSLMYRILTTHMMEPLLCVCDCCGCGSICWSLLLFLDLIFLISFFVGWLLS